MASMSVHARVGRGRIAVSSVMCGPSVLQPSRPLGAQPVSGLQHKRARHAGSTSQEGNAASLVASATPSASGPSACPAAPEARGLGGRRSHAAWLSVAAGVIAAARRAAVRLTASHGNACARTNDISCLREPSVTSVRNMLESCDNLARRAKSHGAMFGRTEQTNVKFHRPTASSIKTSKQGFLTRYALNSPVFF
jgi:hypothetical protein